MPVKGAEYKIGEYDGVSRYLVSGLVCSGRHHRCGIDDGVFAGLLEGGRSQIPLW